MYAITNRRHHRGTFGGKEAADHALSHVALGLDGKATRMNPAVFRRRVLDELRELARTHENPVIILPIHGFNVDWTQALEFFQGIDRTLTQEQPGAITVGFSWPSAGRVTGYVGDRLAARSSAIAFTCALRATLKLLQQEKCPAHLVAVCHSMGNYLVSKAAAYVVEAEGLRGYQVFREVLMVAPDVDGGAFADGGVSVDLASLARRVTVYRSIHDGALVSSRAKRGGMTGGRLGRQGPDPGPLPQNVAVVDASAWTDVGGIRAHSEHFRSRPVLDDMRAVIAGKDRSAIPGRELRCLRGGQEFVLLNAERDRLAARTLALLVEGESG